MGRSLKVKGLNEEMMNPKSHFELRRGGIVLATFYAARAELGAKLAGGSQRARERMANHPAAGKAGIAPQLTIGHHWPGLPEKL
jgi:hypothetical protein